MSALIGELAFLCASALFGGAMLLADPTGGSLEMPLRYLRDAPFEDYSVPGALLFGVLGLGSLVALHGLWSRPGWRWAERVNPRPGTHWAWSASVAVGVALVVWIATQLALIGYASLLQPVYGALGGIILATALHPSVRRALER